jgi:hypothetical protein
VAVTVAGEAEEFYTNASWPGHDGTPTGFTLDARGRWWGGWCVAHIDVTWAEGYAGFCQQSHIPIATPSWKKVKGAGVAIWNRRRDTSCGTSAPCRKYTGSYSVSYTRPAVTFDVYANRYVVASGGAVTISAKVTPGTFGGINTPFAVTKWEWTPDGGSPVSPDPCAPAALDIPNPKTCPLQPTTSGTIKVYAKVNGVALSQSLHIRVRCAATGNALMDSLPVLDLAARAWALSGQYADTGTQVSRREHYFAFWCPPGGVCRDTVINLGTTCGGTPPPASAFPGLIFDGHTHPYYAATPRGLIGSYARDTLPDFCGDLSDTATTATQPVPSSEDIHLVSDRNQSNPPVTAPHYVLDALRFDVIPGGQMSDAARLAATDTISRQLGACTIP